MHLDRLGAMLKVGPRIARMVGQIFHHAGRTSSMREATKPWPARAAYRRYQDYFKVPIE